MCIDCFMVERVMKMVLYEKHTIFYILLLFDFLVKHLSRIYYNSCFFLVLNVKTEKHSVTRMLISLVPYKNSQIVFTNLDSKKTWLLAWCLWFVLLTCIDIFVLGKYLICGHITIQHQSHVCIYILVQIASSTIQAKLTCETFASFNTKNRNWKKNYKNKTNKEIIIIIIIIIL